MGSELQATYIRGELEQFVKIDPKTIPEPIYLGRWNMLLTLVFPAYEDYEVVPQLALEKREAWSKDIEIITTFVVMYKGNTVVFLEVTPATLLNSVLHRSEVDKRMRGLFHRKFAIPGIYALSAFGRQFAIYHYDVATSSTSPTKVDLDVGPGKSIDCAPRARWNHDLVATEGRAKFSELVEDVKRMIKEASS